MQNYHVILLLCTVFYEAIFVLSNKQIMANNTFSTLLLIAVLTLTNIAAKANIEPTPTTSTLQITVLSKQQVMLKANITNNAAQYFEIEKSYDNVNFTTVCVLMPFDASNDNKTLSIKDTINKGNKKIYYRLKKVQDNNLTYTAQQTIQL